MALSCGPKGRAPTAQAAGGAAAGGLGIWPQASTAPKGRAHARLSTNRSSKLLFNPTDIARPIRFRNAEAIPAIRPETSVSRGVAVDVDYTPGRLRHSTGSRRMPHNRFASETSLSMCGSG